MSCHFGPLGGKPSDEKGDGARITNSSLDSLRSNIQKHSVLQGSKNNETHFFGDVMDALGKLKEDDMPNSATDNSVASNGDNTYEDTVDDSDDDSDDDDSDDDDDDDDSDDDDDDSGDGVGESDDDGAESDRRNEAIDILNPSDNTTTPGAAEVVNMLTYMHTFDPAYDIEEISLSDDPTEEESAMSDLSALDENVEGKPGCTTCSNGEPQAIDSDSVSEKVSDRPDIFHQLLMNIVNRSFSA